MSAPRDTDLNEWINASAFHPADSKLKQKGHELARKAVVALGQLLHWLLPPGRAKSLAFTHLELTRLYANMALAVGKGPQLLARDEAYTELALDTALGNLRHVDMPSDPRIAQYEETQRQAATGPQADAAPGPVITEAAEPGIYAEKDTQPADTFRESFQDGEDYLLKVVGGRGVVAIGSMYITGAVEDVVIPRDTEGDLGWYFNLNSPTEVNQFLAAVAAAGERAFADRV